MEDFDSFLGGVTAQAVFKDAFLECKRVAGSSNDAEDEFVEQVKADAESAPTIEDTLPKEGE